MAGRVCSKKNTALGSGLNLNLNLDSNTWASVSYLEKRDHAQFMELLSGNCLVQHLVHGNYCNSSYCYFKYPSYEGRN